ncbi:unnamed protein product [Boreogadus saida]
MTAGVGRPFTEHRARVRVRHNVKPRKMASSKISSSRLQATSATTRSRLQVTEASSSGREATSASTSKR